MYIYRLETEAGRGIYQILDREELPINFARHPVPSRDRELAQVWGRLEIGALTHFYFGFKNIEQLRYWFYDDEWLITAARKGVGLSVWEAPDECEISFNDPRTAIRRVLTVPGWHAGYTQAVFVKRAAKRVYFNERTLEAVELLKDHTWEHEDKEASRNTFYHLI